MPAADRAGYTVTMFLIDTSPSMGKSRTVTVLNRNGEEQTTQMTHLEWALQFVKLKIQEMIYNGRKTDQCGVIVFGSEGKFRSNFLFMFIHNSVETDNKINEANGGYEHVSEYIPIAQPNAATLSKLDMLKASDQCGDPVDALIVGIEAQAAYLGSKKWTRKIVLVTDGESPIEVEDWEATAEKMNSTGVSLTVVYVKSSSLSLACIDCLQTSGVDFDDEGFGYNEPDKSEFKKVNEAFYHQFVSALSNGYVGTCEDALQETARPDIKETRSTLMATVLRLGDVDIMPDQAIELVVKTAKCTAISRPKSWKKFGMRESKSKEAGEEESIAMEDDEDLEQATKVAYAQLKMRTEYYVDQSPEADAEDDFKMEDDDEDLLTKKAAAKSEEQEKTQHLEKVEKEELVRGFKYGTTYAPCPDGQFPRLNTRKGIDICGFFPAKNPYMEFRREFSMGEIQYIWGDPTSAKQQAALSSIVKAMQGDDDKKKLMAIARWVTKDGMDPKMGVLTPVSFDEVDCLLWAQMPFADDVRKYTFASLENLVNKKGEVLTEHPFIPTEEQIDAMDNFVDAMDLMDAGEKDEEGNRLPWFSTLESYNASAHRTKQAMFHCAVTSDLSVNPLPPPHPELLKYFEPPKRVLKRSRDALEECKNMFKVKQVPKKVAKTRHEDHAHAQDEDDNIMLLDGKQPSLHATMSQVRISEAEPSTSTPSKAKAAESETEDEDDEELVLDRVDNGKKPATPSPTAPRSNQPLPTPARSMSPDVDPGRAPGRIIGSTYPLDDFKKNISQGDVVTKAVEDLALVITEIVMRPFASRRHNELIECMTTLRETALLEDEIDAWNAFLVDLKDKCTSQPGNQEFWEELKGIGRPISLISNKEAKQHGGTSKVSESGAINFFN
ncbi:hypothetical protein H0H92_008713 [Tricholoma furcatifolium]|nr:hypothetical protein H0H92_008713 [Tricholoma furcatifolium]